MRTVLLLLWLLFNNQLFFTSQGGRIRIMTTFIKKKKLTEVLEKGNWFFYMIDNKKMCLFYFLPWFINVLKVISEEFSKCSIIGLTSGSLFMNMNIFICTYKSYPKEYKGLKTSLVKIVNYQSSHYINGIHLLTYNGDNSPDCGRAAVLANLMCWLSHVCLNK